MFNIKYVFIQPLSVQFSCSVMSDSLWPHGLQHTRPPCSLPTPRPCSDLCPLSQWRHPAISSSVIPFSSCFQSFLASGAFQMSQFFTSGGQSIGASASVLPMNTQDWSPLGWTGWISLQSKGLSRVFSNTAVQKHQFFSAQLSLYSRPQSRVNYPFQHRAQPYSASPGLLCILPSVCWDQTVSGPCERQALFSLMLLAVFRPQLWLFSSHACADLCSAKSSKETLCEAPGFFFSVQRSLPWPRWWWSGRTDVENKKRMDL